MRTFLQGAVSVVLVMTLASCGYHLAGRGENSGRLFLAELKQVSVEGLGRYENFRSTLISTLRSYGIRVVSGKRASARLIFGDPRWSRKIGAVGDDVKSREYILFSEVNFSVVSGGEDFQTLLPKQTVRAQGNYLADPDHPLRDESEKRAVMKDIESELCRKIVLRLTAVEA